MPETRAAPSGANDRRRIPAGRLTILLILLATIWAPPAPGQEAPGDVVELTLEELLEVQVIPVNVMGSHIHSKGEWMVGYHLMSMDMEGSRSGEERVTTAQVLQSFPVTPVNMTTEAHMFELMYGISDRVTLMIMAPYLRKEMDHVTRMGGEFTTVAEGLGDIRLMTHIVLARKGPHWWIFTPGIGLPTGSIDERDVTPAGPDQLLPYPMQLGGGSLEAIPMLNYIYQKPKWLSGIHMMAVQSMEENDRGYEVGDRLHLSFFMARKVSDGFSLSWRLNGRSMDAYHGQDAELNPAIVYTADPQLRGGDRVDAALGFNFYVGGRGGGAFGHRFLLEAAVPVFQDLDGPQLEMDLGLTFAWQWTF